MTTPQQPLTAAIASTGASDNQLRIGIVKELAPLIVGLQGGDVVNPGVLFATAFAIGDNVAMLRQEDTWLVFGPVSTSDLVTITGPVSFSGAIGADTTASASFSDLGNAQRTFVKRFENTRLRMDFSASCYTTAVNTGVEFGLQMLINVAGAGVVSTGPAMLINTANEHTMMANFAYVSGVTAGTYSIRPLWRRTSGAGTLTTDANDWMSYAVQEVF